MARGNVATLPDPRIGAIGPEEIHDLGDLLYVRREGNGVRVTAPRAGVFGTGFDFDEAVRDAIRKSNARSK